MSEAKFSIETGVAPEEINPIERGKYLRHRIVFKGDTISVDLEKELRVVEEDLVKCMAEHTGVYAYWVSLASLAKRHLRQKKEEMKVVCGRLDLIAREDLKNHDIKVTEAGVKNYIESHTSYQIANEEMINLEDMVELLDSILRALDQRSGMLKEINRAQCNEFYQK